MSSTSQLAIDCRRQKRVRRPGRQGRCWNLLCRCDLRRAIIPGCGPGREQGLFERPDHPQRWRRLELKHHRRHVAENNRCLWIEVQPMPAGHSLPHKLQQPPEPRSIPSLTAQLTLGVQGSRGTAGRDFPMLDDAANGVVAGELLRRCDPPKKGSAPRPRIPISLWTVSLNTCGPTLHTRACCLTTRRRPRK